jgi:hypothetical protein
MTEPNPDAWVERIKLIGEAAFGAKYRPQYAYMVATGAANPDDMMRIASFVDALDVAKAARMNRMAGVLAEHTAMEQDYLNTLGEGGEVVRFVNRDAQGSGDQDPSWWAALGNRVARYVGQSGELIFPDDNPFAGVSAEGSVEGDFDFSMLNPGNQLLWGLEQLARVPGFLYRTIDDVAATQTGRIDVEQLSGMVAQGYDPGNIWDRIAFNWTNGESDFRSLESVREEHGEEMTNQAVAVFRAGGVEAYMSDLEAKVRAGSVSPEAYAEIIDRFNDPDWEHAFDAVDRQHTSFGRDVARLILPEGAEDGGWFTAVSGTFDTALALTLDPILAGSKVGRAAYMSRYAVSAINDQKIFRLYGVGTNPRTGQAYTEAADPIARANVEDFLARAASIRAHRTAGREIDEAAELAAIQRAHPQLMPLFNEVNGQRFALTPDEVARANREGTFATSVNHGEPYPVINGDPITTVDDWAHYLVDTGALARVIAGRSAREGYLIPGRTGWWAERQFVRNHRMNAAGRKADKTRERLLDNPPLPASTTGVDNTLVVSSLDDLIRQAEDNPDRIIAWDWSEKMKHEFIERGQQFYDERTGVQGTGREMKAMWEATQRRFSTLLPENHVIAFNSTTAGKDIERFARTFLPKHEAVRLRAIWERGSEATRRQIGKAIVLEVAEAAGLTRSAVGRRFIQRWMDDLDEVNTRRYGLGETDRIVDRHGNVKRVALNMSQMENYLLLPSFTEMKRAAAKATLLGMDIPVTDRYLSMLRASLPGKTDDEIREIAEMSTGATSWRQAWEEQGATLLGRLALYPTSAFRYMMFSSKGAERILAGLKLGYILTFANFERNMFEEYAAIQASGRGSDLRYGKELLRADGQTTSLIAAAHHLIPKAERTTIRSAEDVELAVTRGRWRGGDRPLRQAEEMALREIAERQTRPELQRVMGARDDTMPEGGYADAIAMHQGGVLAEQLHMRVPKDMELAGYDEIDLVADNPGLEALRAMWVRSFGDEREPARRALAHIMWHEASENPAFLASLDESTIRLMQELSPTDNASFLEALAVVTQRTAGHARRNQAGMIMPSSVKSIEDYVGRAEETGRFRQQSEFLRTDERGYPIKDDDLLAQAGAVSRYTRAQIRNVTAMVSDRTGNSMNPALVSDLLHGRIPGSANDLRAYGGIEQLPKHVIQAEYVPAASRHPLSRLGIGLVNGMAKAYDFVVTMPMQRMIRKPMFVGSYVRHRQETHAFELMLVGKHGWKPEHAKQVAADMAWGQAVHDVVRFIDNPNQSSQFAVLARNWWLFERAQEDALRRWFRVIKERPETLQYAQLAVNAGIQTGLIDLDTEGNLTLTYPGSGAVLEAFMHVGAALGAGDGVKIPHVDDLTTQLSYLNPSILNPVGYSATPLVSVPFSMLAAAIPGDDMLKANIELAMEGDLGAGRAWWETFMPTALRRFVELGFDHDDLGSTVGGAAATALLNATVLGQVPDGSNSDEMQDFVANTQTQALNALIGRALFGFFAPAAPSLPELYGQGEADWAWRERGIQGLHDEFRAMVAALGRDKALVAWAELHPEALIYDIGRTEVGAPGASFGVALGSAEWVFQNRQMFEDSDYRSVAAYFVPDHPGEFNPTAWNALLQIGVRQYKDISQYYRQIVERHAVSEWFDVRDAEEAELAEARENGDPIGPIEERYGALKDRLKVKYPILLQFFSESQARSARRQEQVRALERLVNDPDISREAIPDIDGVVGMLQLHSQYEAALEQIRGQQSTQSSAIRRQVEEQYHESMQDIIARYPALNDLYQGVFRYLQD